MSATDERGGSGETAKLTTAEIADVFAFTPQQAAEFEDGDLELQMETGNQYYERLERLQRAYSPGEILGLLDPIVETGGFDGADGGNAVSITSPDGYVFNVDIARAIRDHVWRESRPAGHFNDGALPIPDGGLAQAMRARRGQ